MTEGHDYSVCLDTEDGKHLPVSGGYDPELGDAWCPIECKACGQTTGYAMPAYDEIDWG